MAIKSGRNSSTFLPEKFFGKIRGFIGTTPETLTEKGARKNSGA